MKTYNLEETMEYHDLQKTRVVDLREMMKEHLPEVTGITAKKKDELVELLADKLGIEKPTKHVAAGLGKRAIKATHPRDEGQAPGRPGSQGLR